MAMLALFFSGRVAAAIRDGGIDPANLGKGDWIYSMTDATNKLGGHVASVTNETSLMLFYRSQGVRYIIIKAATSDQLFNGCYSFPQFTTSLVNIAHANGIFIMAYNRSYGANVPGEIAIADYMFQHGADGFVFDAEAEWESNQTWIGTNGPALAWQLCSTVRSNWPTKFLAHAPFPIISFHTSFPYKEFGYWCDTIMPQIYHFGSASLKGSQSAGIAWSDANWTSWQNSLIGKSTNINGVNYYWTNAIKPLAPINDVYGPGSHPTCEGSANPYPDNDVMEFIDYLSADPNAVTPGGYKGVSFWRADLHGTGQWANIKAGSSGNFTNVINNIVIDDPNAVPTGAWTAQRTFYNGSYFGGTTDTNSFGTNYLFKSKGTGAAYVQFTPYIVVPGYYDVYEWHPQRTDASASVPFVVNYNGGSATVLANQQVNSGTWNLLGRFGFAAGTAGNIRVTDGIPEAGAVALVDGLKLVYASAPSPPPPPLIGNVKVQARANGGIFTWVTLSNATSQVQFGLTTNLGNSSAFDATLLTNHLVWLDGLAASSPYYYQVVSTIGTNVYTSPIGSFSTDVSIVVDAPHATFSGVWTIDTAAQDKYSSYYQYASSDPASNTAQAVFRPTITSEGTYDVFLWYPEGTNRSTHVPVLVSSAGGDSTANVNQTINGGRWQLLVAGQFFAAGTNGFVQLGNGTGENNRLVMADAVRFYFHPGQDVRSDGTVPGWWAGFYFGTNSISGAIDADGDGYTTFQEYVIGTSPLEFDSRLKVRAQSSGQGSLQVIFSPAQGGRIYQLQGRTNLSLGSWVTIPTSPQVVNTNGEGMLTVTNFYDSRNFLRLSVQMAP